MKSKKITAWVVLVAMLMSLMPTSLVFAAAPTNNPTPYPEIVTDVFSSMTIDADGVTSGTDLDLVNNSDKLPVIDTTPGSVVTSAAPVAGVDEGAYKGQDDKLTAVKRKQILTFVAKSQADLLSDRTFIDETGPMKIVPNAVEIAYMDADKNPLVLDLNSKFNMTKATDWSTDGVWIDIAEDIQITDVVLETFLSTTPLLDKRNGNILDKEKITAAQLFATDDMVSFMIYNVINGDFSGFLRVKITDKGGNTTVQDYPVVADGQYPVASIKTSTLKNPVGSDVAVTAENTFIPEMVFKTPVDTFVSETKMSYRHYEWTADDANTAEVDDGKTMLKKALAWQHPDYKSEEIWAMDEVVVDEIEISDLAVSSGVTSVTYDIKNFTLEENVDASSLEGSIPVAYDGATNTCDLTTNPIKITEEGFNVLAITVEDLAGLKTTCRYYFFIDTTPPEAKFEIVSLEKNVAELFTASDVVTNRQLAIGMEDSEDIKTSSLTVISGIRAKDEAGDPIFVAKEERYQYRLLARDYAIADADVDFSNVTDGIPYGYTATAPADTNLTYGKWLVWSGSIEEAVINEEFEGIIQVRVQDRAGNWSSIVSEASDGKETIITDNTNAEIEVNVYANDGDATTVDEIKTGVATNVLDDSDRNVDNAENTDKNETITTITGDTMPWISDSAVMAVKITDEDLINAIRSSGLEKGQITVNAEFNKENQNKEIKIWKKDGSQPDTEDPGLIGNSVEFEIAKEHIFGDDDSTLDYNEADKALTFYLEYEGTGAVDITVSIKDQADVNDGDDFTVIYKTQLRVDKINPYIIYKGYDITDADKTDLLKANTAKVDYEVRNMPWGPNSQVLEVVVKDDDITPVQSKTKNIKFCTNKAIDLYKVDGATFTKVKTYAAGNDNIVSLSDCEELANEKYESNVGYKFYLVYEGTGIAKVEFYAEDSATEPNVRNYPSVATAADAEPVLYDAMLRVDKINPEIKNAKLVQTDADVEDKGWFFNLFTFNKTDVDVNTRKQMKITFEVVDETTTTEQSGVNIQNEKISGVDLIDVYDKYVEKDKTHLYDNEATAYITDDANDVAVDPNIDYILLPVEAGEINGTGGTFTEAASASNKDIEALVAEYLDKEYNEDGDKCEWKKASWKDGGIVVPDEFQGAIVLRTIDRVGNIDYSEPITFVAESREALIDFDPQNGYIWSQNNYGWSKRDYDYVEIRVKDDNEGKVDAWLENVFISVTDLEGNDISANDSVKYSYPNIHANDANLEVDPSGYTYVSLTEFANEAAYGYDVISKDGLVEKLARDEEGYIHLGYVRVAESAQIKVTIFDKAKANDVEYTGNKTTGIWTSRIDRVAPVVTEFDLVPVYQGDASDANNNGYALKVKAEDKLSGMAPDITEAEYNVYTPENIPVTGVFNTDASYLYKITNDADVEIERYNSGTFNAGQYEMPGLQYALIPGNGDLEDVAPWNFEADPSTIYDENGYNGEMGKPYVWHNYIDDKTPMIPDDFDGLIVVRAIDKAGNITVVGYSSILDVEADDDWHNETQYIQVRTDNKWDDGTVVNVQYYGNNNLLFPVDMRKDLSNSLNNGEGAVIEIAEEGITNVVITATEEFAAAKTAKANKDKRNADWEGDMYIGNATTAGYQDWKFQVVDVKIDKQAPSVRMTLTDKDGNVIEDDAVEGTVKIEANIFDPIPNIPDELGYRSHIPSEVIKVEWCAIPEGSEEENWIFATDWENGNIGTFDADAFTGTIKVRAIDNAGNVTEKSQRLNVDGVEALISIEAPAEWQKSSVLVPVTVSENAEFSDVVKVTYKATHTENGTEIVETGELPLNGGTILVSEEGITEIVVTATTKADVIKTAEATVKIDSVAPEFRLITTGNGAAVNTEIEVTIKDLVENTSLVKTVEWCAIPEGSGEEAWKAATDWKNGEIGTFDANAFTGTIKVRVTDNAGNVTVKSQRINIDQVKPIISISNDSTGKCSHDPVTVFVTVSENAEFSDVVKVTYKATHTENGTEIVETGELPLNGGTITVDWEGETKVEVTAINKADVTETAETTVLIHYSDVNVSKLKGTVAKGSEELKSGDWVLTNSIEVDYTDSAADPVWYSINGGSWTKVEFDNEETAEKKENIILDQLKPGANIVRIQARKEMCLCKSDVNTYIVNYDNGTEKPAVSVMFNSNAADNWCKDAATISITANKAGSASEIRGIEATLQGNYENKIHLGPNGGDIVIQEEGVWYLEKIIVTMESGKQYILANGTSGQREEFFGTIEEYDLKPSDESKYDNEKYTCVVAKIDRTAPTVERGAIDFVETINDALNLFIVEDYYGTKTLRLAVDGNYVKDSTFGDVATTSGIAKYEYTVVENGAVSYDWKTVNVLAVKDDDGEITNKNELPLVTDRAFKGTVLLKVTDFAGNETIISRNVFTEGEDPEVSLTAPLDWQTKDVVINVDVAEREGVSSGIKYIDYTLTNNKTDEVVMEGGYGGASNDAKFNSHGGQILVNKDGEYTLTVTATDRLGNSATQSVTVKIDKTAPTYSGSVTPSLFNIHRINNWDDIHDGWTYNHAVDISGIVDDLSGVKEIKVTATTETGNTISTVLDSTATGTSFDTDGTYALEITDNAGNVRNLTFVINKKLTNVINVVGVDEYGKVNVAVTDGDERLSFYSVEDEVGAADIKLHNGVTNQLWDGRTGIRYIYGKNDSGKITNKLHVFVAPSNEYDISLSTFMDSAATSAPNRFVDIDAEGANVKVTQVDKLFAPGILKDVQTGSSVKINEDGVYSIITNN